MKGRSVLHRITGNAALQITRFKGGFHPKFATSYENRCYSLNGLSENDVVHLYSGGIL